MTIAAWNLFYATYFEIHIISSIAIYEMTSDFVLMETSIAEI